MCSQSNNLAQMHDIYTVGISLETKLTATLNKTNTAFLKDSVPASRITMSANNHQAQVQRRSAVYMVKSENEFEGTQGRPRLKDGSIFHREVSRRFNFGPPELPLLTSPQNLVL